MIRDPRNPNYMKGGRSVMKALPYLPPPQEGDGLMEDGWDYMMTELKSFFVSRKYVENDF